MAKQAFDEQQEPSLEDILRTIKGVISGEGEENMVETSKDEPLELTEVVEEDGTISNHDMNQITKDVLDSIDHAIDGKPKNNAKEEETEPDKKEVESTQDNVKEAAEEVIQEEKMEEANIEEEEKVEVMDDVSKKIKVKKSLLSNKSAEKSSKALEELVKSVPKRSRTSPGFRDGVTLEDIVIESLKPYLAEWLDDNLPQIVKELVAKEIKRLVPTDDD